MENDADAPLEKNIVNKVKSHNIAAPRTLKNEPVKRRSLNVNEAVRSLDLALGRLNRSKLINGGYSYSNDLRQLSPVRGDAKDMFIDMDSSSNFNHSIDNTSMMSMNFSHYELVRNLSHSNCNSDGAFSGNTCNANLTDTDSSLKNEHLERYFRSAEMWSRKYKEGGPSAIHFELPEQ